MPDTPSIVIKGGRVVDSTGERDADVVVVDGRIAAVGADLDADRTLDAAGCIGVIVGVEGRDELHGGFALEPLDHLRCVVEEERAALGEQALLRCDAVCDDLVVD